MNVQNKYIPFGCSYDCNWCVKYYYSSTAQQIRQSQCKDRISDGCGHIWMYFYSLSFLLLCEDERGSDYSGKRKNFCKDTVESSHAEQTISSCIGRTDIIWIYIIWQKRGYSVLFYICGRKCLLLHNLFDVHHYSFYHRGSLFSTIIPQVE